VDCSLQDGIGDGVWKVQLSTAVVVWWDDTSPPVNVPLFCFCFWSCKQRMRGAAAGGAGAGGGAGKRNCLSEIQRLERDRDERRKNMEDRKNERAAEEARNRANGNMGDVDFQKMIREYREENVLPEEPHSPPGDMKICICIRKRPISAKEIKKKDHDAVTCSNPMVVVHDCKLKVDGITKYLDNNSFKMDHIFGEEDTTDDIYMYAVQPLAEFVLEGGRATVFACKLLLLILYFPCSVSPDSSADGQTGSGKTFTMVGIQKFIAEDLFHLFDTDPRYQSGRLEIGVSFFEIYGGRCQVSLSLSPLPSTVTPPLSMTCRIF
jgi:kinesin family member 2/24